MISTESLIEAQVEELKEKIPGLEKLTALIEEIASHQEILANLGQVTKNQIETKIDEKTKDLAENI